MPDRTVKRNLFASAFAVLTVGSMALFFNLYEPWQPVGPERVADGAFSTPEAVKVWSGWNEWTRLEPDAGFQGSPGVILNTSSNKHGILRFTLYDLTHVPAFRVSLRATARGVVKGTEGYHLPRAVFFYHDTSAKSLFGLHHGIMDISKDTGWRHYKDYFPVPEGASSARLHIQNLGVAGVMQIDDVSVIPVRERLSVPWWKLFFGTLWVTSFSLCLFTLRPWKRRYGLLTTLTSLIILAGIVMPGKLLDSQIKTGLAVSKTVLRKLTPPSSPEPPAAVKVKAPAEHPAPAKPVKPKEESPLIVLAGTAVDQAHQTGHFVLFSLLAFLASLTWIAVPPSLRRTAAVFAGLILFAAATETLQFITADRAAALSDLRIDAAGMAGSTAAVLLLRTVQRLINRNYR